MTVEKWSFKAADVHWSWSSFLPKNGRHGALFLHRLLRVTD
jgi:hypothetical protein